MDPTHLVTSMGLQISSAISSFVGSEQPEDEQATSTSGSFATALEGNTSGNDNIATLIDDDLDYFSHPPPNYQPPQNNFQDLNANVDEEIPIRTGLISDEITEKEKDSELHVELNKTQEAGTVPVVLQSPRPTRNTGRTKIASIENIPIDASLSTHVNVAPTSGSEVDSVLHSGAQRQLRNKNLSPAAGLSANPINSNASGVPISYVRRSRPLCYATSFPPIEGVQELANEDHAWLRRSTRDPSVYLMEKREIQDLLVKIREDHKDTVVLKIKDHILADINSTVMDAIIDALGENTVCEGLYIQNLDKSITDVQMKKLIELFKSKKIWCLNIGENYEVSNSMWEEFCNSLPDTNITHLYASEHVIDINLKNKMRDFIRENRKKHKLHCSIENIGTIERCTHMWWNPINGVKELKPPPPPPIPVKQEEIVEEKKKIVARELTECDVAYWKQRVKNGQEEKWKFQCICGSQCSWYEHYRYHPVGRMFQCSSCKIWSHVDCVYGANLSDDELENMEEVLCHCCKSKLARARRCSGDGRGSSGENVAVNQISQSKIKQLQIDPVVPSMPPGIIQYDLSLDPSEWKFKCKCGEVCSYYENPLYHPRGAKYACTECGTYGHVACVFGERSTETDLQKLIIRLCSGCQSKKRRSRGGDGPDSFQSLDNFATKKSKKSIDSSARSDHTPLTLGMQQMVNIKFDGEGVSTQLADSIPLQSFSNDNLQNPPNCCQSHQQPASLSLNNNSFSVSQEVQEEVTGILLNDQRLQGQVVDECMSVQRPCDFENTKFDDQNLQLAGTTLSEQNIHEIVGNSNMKIIDSLESYEMKSIIDSTDADQKDGTKNLAGDEEVTIIPDDDVATIGEKLCQLKSYASNELYDKATSTIQIKGENEGRDRHAPAGQTLMKETVVVNNVSLHGTSVTPRKRGEKSTGNSRSSQKDSSKQISTSRPEPGSRKRQKSADGKQSHDLRNNDGDGSNDDDDSKDKKVDNKDIAEYDRCGGKVKRVWVLTDLKNAPEPWKFSCACKETCSHYEHSRYHPKLLKFACTTCHTFSHVHCMFPYSKTIEQDLPYFQEALCPTCKSKKQRSHRGGTLDELPSTSTKTPSIKSPKVFPPTSGDRTLSIDVIQSIGDDPLKNKRAGRHPLKVCSKNQPTDDSSILIDYSQQSSAGNIHLDEESERPIAFSSLEIPLTDTDCVKCDDPILPITSPAQILAPGPNDVNITSTEVHITSHNEDMSEGDNIFCPIDGTLAIANQSRDGQHNDENHGHHNFGDEEGSKIPENDTIFEPIIASPTISLVALNSVQSSSNWSATVHSLREVKGYREADGFRKERQEITSLTISEDVGDGDHDVNQII